MRIVRVFVAGASGAVGRRLVAPLVQRGHQVTGTTTSEAKFGTLKELGAEPVVMDGLDAAGVGHAVAQARPDVIVRQMTAIAGPPDLKHIDRWFATTNRLRTEGTAHLLAAAQATGVQHVVAQSFGAWNGEQRGGWVKTEDDPLEAGVGTAFEAPAAAIRDLERDVLAAGGAVLRYGGFYGPGVTDDMIAMIRKRRFPLVGPATGHASWIHLDDAASATVLAAEQRVRGVFCIVDDEPAPASEWLPYLAQVAGAKRPMRVPVRLARLLAGDVAVAMMVQGRGFSNARATRELGWSLRYPSWRQGFREGLG